MKERRLPILPTLVAAYRDLGRVLMSLRTLILCAFLILLAVSASVSLVPRNLWTRQWTAEALDFAKVAAEAFLLAPIVIAIHRFVILDKVTRNYTVPIGEPAFVAFFGWLLALKVLFGFPFTLLGVFQSLNWSVWATTSVFALALITAAAVMLRLTILLPALAVEVPGATPSHALADTNGYALRVLALFLLGLFPWIAGAFGVAVLLGRGANVAGSPLGMLSLILQGVLQTAATALIAVIASYVFIALAAAVRRPARLQPQTSS
jgi:hypothetical protein